MRWILAGATALVVLLLTLQAMDGDKDWACSNPRVTDGDPMTGPAQSSLAAVLAEQRVPHDRLVRLPGSGPGTIRYEQLVDGERFALLVVRQISSGGYVVTRAFGCADGNGYA